MHDRTKGFHFINERKKKLLGNRDSKRNLKKDKRIERVCFRSFSTSVADDDCPRQTCKLQTRYGYITHIITVVLRIHHSRVAPDE